MPVNQNKNIKDKLNKKYSYFNFKILKNTLRSLIFKLTFIISQIVFLLINNQFDQRLILRLVQIGRKAGECNFPIRTLSPIIIKN